MMTVGCNSNLDKKLIFSGKWDAVKFKSSNDACGVLDMLHSEKHIGL